MTATPEGALRGLRAMAETGQLEALCSRYGVELLVVHGSVTEPDPVRPPQELDLAFRFQVNVTPDVLTLTDDLLDVTRLDSIDLMDLQRAGPVACARALGPQSWPLYEVVPGMFATAQMAALKTERETRPLRLLDLRLMAGRYES